MGTAVKKNARTNAKKTTAKKSSAKNSTSRKATRKPSEMEVRQRAYELFMNRGGQPGRELEDWLQAERELRA